MMKLKPCPFCGGTNVVVKQDHCLLSGHKYWFVTHSARDCVLTDSFGQWHSAAKFSTKEKAIESWNMRFDKNHYLDQILWERNIAMSQLEEHDIPFGGIAPNVLEVVRCNDCEYWDRNNISCEGLAKCVTGESGIRYRNKNDFCSRGKQHEHEIN